VGQIGGLKHRLVIFDEWYTKTEEDKNMGTNIKIDLEWDNTGVPTKQKAYEDLLDWIFKPLTWDHMAHIRLGTVLAVKQRANPKGDTELYVEVLFGDTDYVGIDAEHILDECRLVPMWISGKLVSVSLVPNRPWR
jgi:hypothetical protein